MKINLAFRHMKATEGLKTYTRQKIEKLTKYLMKGERLAITFSMIRYAYCVDITLFEKNHVFKARSETTDMYASVDQALHSLEQQLKRFKEKKKHYHNYFKSQEGLLREAADIFDQRLTRERQTKRAWKRKNRDRKKAA